VSRQYVHTMRYICDGYECGSEDMGCSDRVPGGWTKGERVVIKGNKMEKETTHFCATCSRASEEPRG
jgi:hypothetical protein